VKVYIHYNPGKNEVKMFIYLYSQIDINTVKIYFFYFRADFVLAIRLRCVPRVVERMSWHQSRTTRRMRDANNMQ